jgi:hypothetical protein
MTQALTQKEIHLLIQKAIQELSEEQQKTVERIAEALRKIIETSDLGPIALALVGAEYSLKGDE